MPTPTPNMTPAKLIASLQAQVTDQKAWLEKIALGLRMPVNSTPQAIAERAKFVMDELQQMAAELKK